jgi:hypothetical protein
VKHNLPREFAFRPGKKIFSPSFMEVKHIMYVLD